MADHLLSNMTGTTADDTLFCILWIPGVCNPAGCETIHCVFSFAQLCVLITICSDVWKYCKSCSGTGLASVLIVWLIIQRKCCCGMGWNVYYRQLYITADGGTIGLDWVMSPHGKSAA